MFISNQAPVQITVPMGVEGIGACFLQVTKGNIFETEPFIPKYLPLLIHASSFCSVLTQEIFFDSVVW